MRTKLIDKIGGHLWITRRALFLLGGSVALLLALVGAIMPVMPTTPFLLLSAYCYARSSRRCHTWLTTNRFFGRYIARMAEGRRLSLPAKGVLIASSWCTATLSAVFFAPNLAVRIAGLSMAAAMSTYILLQGRRQVQCVPEEARSPRPRQR
ncbi:MAG: YbaN family protein [Thermoleophilia bacterium]|jgi:uncharacterized membrane protein YbaN (DUF454 family)